MARPKATEAPERDLALHDDTRLLGRILGEIVCEQQGQAIFEVVEHIRQTSIRFHRTEDRAAQRELEATLSNLSRDTRQYLFFPQDSIVLRLTAKDGILLYNPDTPLSRAAVPSRQ